MNEYFLEKPLKKNNIETVQINMGNLCNLSCSHCHVEGSPGGTKVMSEETSLKIIDKLKKMKSITVEFTGGEPLLNGNLKTFIKALHGSCELTVRSNLIAMHTPSFYEYLELFKKYNVRIVGSLPSAFEESTDSQRGGGVFQKTISIIKKINSLGLDIDLVFNPTGSYVVENPAEIEERYRKVLKEEYEIEFNNFISMVNVPIKRFKEFLEKEGTFDEYCDDLKSKFNPATVSRVMCRNLISVDYEGFVYDCDFNLACGKKIKGKEKVKFWEIDFNSFKPEITLDSYCYACTVNQGSSCQGTLINSSSEIKENVKKYYGETLQSSDDLKTSACCTLDDLPVYVKESLKYINDESVVRYYGCGSPIPLALEGLSSLDVGCGTGRDVFILSRLAGEKGHAYGIDLTANQINIAQKHAEEQMKVFGYKGKNVFFVHDEMENLSKHFPNDSLDLVISNCVLNLAEDKEVVLKQIYDILKQGGEFYFSDVFADRRVPDEIRGNEVLYGECLGGALYSKDFERKAKKVGFTEPRLMNSRSINVENDELRELTGNINFYSMTWRLWKIKGLEDACEDYGHVAIYRGGIKYSPHFFVLDDGHIFYKNKPERVCGNTALMISRSRFGEYFDIIGDFTEHFGLFEDCGNGDRTSADETGGGCC